MHLKIENRRNWRFWIDVGGTFTDCLAVSPEGDMRATKVLSSGAVKGRVGKIREGLRVVDRSLKGYPDDFFRGFRITFFSEASEAGGDVEGRVVRFISKKAELTLETRPDRTIEPGTRFELRSGEPAPLLAIRLALGLKLEDAIGPHEVRLGTTRATNALLERKGAKVAFVTTAGFGDVLRIGNQDRPKLFDLNIKKPAELYVESAEIAERLAADGSVVRDLDRDEAARVLSGIKSRGADALAICLMNAYRNAAHEEALREIAVGAGFAHVSISSEVSPTIKIVPRGDTTVVDAYLTPVIRDYIESIAIKMPDASLRLMTNAGGLAAPDAVSGKDVLLSGPAGGVVGFSEAARAAGCERAIGFDMGGTSTDVSRFDGEFNYEFETTKAGVRIVAPMLAIETVAAGGGSICDFDGQKLTVGPESAGADPGPACYGKGGPLALTDLNLYLGRLLPGFFPFDLDRGAVDSRLEAMAARVAESTGKALTPTEIAEGFVRIANANMAAAIKRVSVERGYDVREYTLVSFGGAGGQHACALARELGIARVLVHGFAGVLSAFGMGVADVRKFAVRTVLRPLDPASLDRLESAFGELERDLEAQMAEEGFAPENGPSSPLRRLRSLDLRYRGQSSTIEVKKPDDGDYAAAFEAAHRRLYGHAFEGREVEIVTLRLQCVGRTERPEFPESEIVRRAPKPHSVEQATFGGVGHETLIYRWEKLRPGDEIVGPAMIVQDNSAILVDPGWEARMSGRGDLLIEDHASRSSKVRASRLSEDRSRESSSDHEIRSSEVRAGASSGDSAGASGGEAAASEPSPIALDPIAFEIFGNQFTAIAEQMGATLRRTALSVNVKERLDFSCALFTPEGDLVANAPHVPVHLGAMSECIKRVLEDVSELAPGDVLVTNDPMRGGSHLPDITVITPVFDAGSGDIIFFTASRAHHAEIGGIRPGSMAPDSKNLGEEGVLIRNLKVVEKGVEHFDRLRELLTNGKYPSRAPEENLADVAAQIAANERGVSALRAMVDRSGLATVHAYMGYIQEAAAAKVRQRLSKFEDGTYEFADTLDDGSPIRVSITISGDAATLDFTGSAPVLPGNLNANRAIVTAAVIYCFRCLIGEDIPLNSGVLDPIEIVLPEGCLNPPVYENADEAPAVAGGNVETSQRVVDVILGALGAAAASQGTMNNLTFGNADFGYYETICGGAGAGPDFDGADAVHTHMTNTRLTDPEVLEAEYPVRLRRFEIRRGSGGEGRRRGGDGVRREIEFLAPLEVSVLSQRRTTAPFGLEGGAAGEPGRNLLIRADGPPAGASSDSASGDDAGFSDGSAEELPGQVSFRASMGDRLIIETPGGGGFGEARAPD